MPAEAVAGGAASAQYRYDPVDKQVYSLAQYRVFFGAKWQARWELSYVWPALVE